MGLTKRASILAIGLLAVAGCGDDEDDTDDHMQEQELAPCFEWQRFMRHAGHDMTEVSESGEGTYTFTQVGFIHAGSWELNFNAASGATTDMFQLYLCVDGMLPFEVCFDDDASNDENCDKAIDVRCRGDEVDTGDVVTGMHGKLKAEVLSITPTPPNDTDMATIEIRLLDDSASPVENATITKSECAGPDNGASPDHGHSAQP